MIEKPIATVVRIPMPASITRRYSQYGATLQGWQCNCGGKAATCARVTKRTIKTVASLLA